MTLVALSVYQRPLSGPTVMPVGRLFTDGA
jgi:hypothetical protein